MMLSTPLVCAASSSAPETVKFMHRNAFLGHNET